MYISSKVVAQTATTILMALVGIIVTHFGLTLNAVDTTLITSSVTVVAGAFAGWYVKEADPDELKRSATRAKLVRDFKEKSHLGSPTILPLEPIQIDPRFEHFEVRTADGGREVILTHRTNL